MDRPNRIKTQADKWSDAYWRWFLEALDAGDYSAAFERADTLNKIEQQKRKGQDNEQRKNNP